MMIMLFSFAMSIGACCLRRRTVLYVMLLLMLLSLTLLSLLMLGNLGKR
jgi:hypothetical protein